MCKLYILLYVLFAMKSLFAPRPPRQDSDFKKKEMEMEEKRDKAPPGAFASRWNQGGPEGWGS